MSDQRDTALLRLAEALADPAHPTKLEVSEWAGAHLCQRDLVTADHESSFGLDDWRRCAERGLTDLFVPEQLGGSGADLASSAVPIDALAPALFSNTSVAPMLAAIFWPIVRDSRSTPPPGGTGMIRRIGRLG